MKLVKLEKCMCGNPNIVIESHDGAMEGSFYRLTCNECRLSTGDVTSHRVELAQEKSERMWQTMQRALKGESHSVQYDDFLQRFDGFLYSDDAEKMPIDLLLLTKEFLKEAYTFSQPEWSSEVPTEDGHYMFKPHNASTPFCIRIHTSGEHLIQKCTTTAVGANVSDKPFRGERDWHGLWYPINYPDPPKD